MIHVAAVRGYRDRHVAAIEYVLKGFLLSEEVRLAAALDGKRQRNVALVHLRVSVLILHTILQRTAVGGVILHRRKLPEGIHEAVAHSHAQLLEHNFQ